jgi:integrase
VVTLYKRGGVWGIQYRVDGKQVRVSLRTTNRKLAEEQRLRNELELAQKRLGWPATVLPAALPGGGAVAAPTAPPEPAPPVVVDLATIRAEYAAWSLAHKRPKTIQNDKARLATFFATVEGKALREIRTADIERFLTVEAGAGKKPATLMRHREILHAFWRWAVRQGHAERNIVSEVPRPRLPERDPVFLNLEQVEALLHAIAGTAVEGPVATAVFAGLRREELCWLTGDDLELDRVPAILRVRAKTIAGESWQPKTKRDRKVPVSPRLLEVLQKLREEGRRKGVPWLFPSPRGARWDPDNLSREFREVAKANQLPWNLLELRHTFGSQLARKGVSLLKIAKLMGNSPEIAARHYINLVPEEMAEDVAF